MSAVASEGSCFRARESVLGPDVALRADALRDHAAQEGDSRDAAAERFFWTRVTGNE